MRQRGRKRADDRDVTDIEDPRYSIEPPEHLSAAEKKIFADVVAASPIPFIESDIFLLSTFATLTHHARTAARDVTMGWGVHPSMVTRVSPGVCGSSVRP